LAHFIRDSFNCLFLTHAEFFTSSGGILPGEQWLKRLELEIKEADSILLLLSKKSLNRPWINIEAGAFWISGKNLFPLSHADLTIKEIHRPLSDFQSTHLYDPRSVGQLIASIAKRIGLQSSPSFDAEKFCATVKEIDHALSRIFENWEQITEALDIKVPVRYEDLSQYNIFNESIAINYRIYNGNTLELSSFAKDSAVLRLERPTKFDGKRFLILKVDNTQRSVSQDLDKL
jgi:hypothetical protein